MNWLEKSWYKQGYYSYLLLPLSLLFGLVSMTRRALYRLGLKRQHRSALPVIVVGNITVGGTGKTPFVVYLVSLLQQQGFKPAIVSRGYGAKADAKQPFPRLVTADSEVEYSGDEPKLLAIKTSVPVVIAPKRSEAVAYVSANTDCDIVISDDGLQHYKMARDLEFVLIDQERGLGNGWLLPVGPLREPKSRLQQADMTINNAGFSHDEQVDYRLKPSLPYQLIEAKAQLPAGSKVKLISGIGNPNRFLATAKGIGLQVEGQHWLGDHHNFSLDDFAQFGPDDIVVMTEKDAVKCRQLTQHQYSKNWYVLAIEAELSKAVEQQIRNKINQLTHCNNDNNKA